MKLVKFVVKKVISGLLKIIVVYKEVEAYEEQGILEDGDTDHRDSADGTGNYAGRERLREPLREEKKEELSVFSFFFFLSRNELTKNFC